MKTSSKVLLTIGGGFMAVGLIMLAIGGSMGGISGRARKFADSSDRYNTMVTTIEEAVAEDFGYEYNYNYNYDYNYDGEEWTYSYTEYEGVDSIEISIDYGEIFITEGSGSSRVTVDATMGTNYSCVVNSGTLEITDNKDVGEKLIKSIVKEGAKTGFNGGEKYLNIYLPDGMIVEDIDISIGAGNVTITDITSKDLEIDCGAGEIYMSANLLGDVEINNGVGNIDVYPSGYDRDFNYKLSTGIGSVYVYGENGSGGSMNFISGSYNKDNDAAKDMAISCGVGEINVVFH